MISSGILEKIDKYNDLRTRADKLQYEIEEYLDREYNINVAFASDTYGMDSNCPIYGWGTSIFDERMIEDIVSFKEDFRRRYGEWPDNKTINEHFAE